MSRIKRFLLPLIVVLCLNMCSCGSAPCPTEGESTEPLDYLIKTEHFFPFETGVNISGIALSGESMIVVGEKDGEISMKLFCVKTSDDGVGFKFKKDIFLNEPNIEEMREIKAMCTGNGRFYVLTGETPRYYYDASYNYVENNEYQGRYALSCYDAKGKLISTENISIPACDNITALAVNANDEVVVAGNAVRNGSYRAYVAELSDRGEVSSDKLLGENIELCSISAVDSSLVISCYGYEKQSALYYKSDFSLSSLSALELDMSINETMSYGNRTQGQALDGEYLVSDDFRFFTCDIATGETTECMRWGYTNQYETVFSYVCQTAPRTFVCVERDKDYISIVRAAPRPSEPPTLVNVAVCGERAQEMQGRVEAFAAMNGGYEYKFTLYSLSELDKFTTSLSAGNTPDLVLFDNCVNTSSQYYDDLYPYIDADPELSREDFLPNLLTSLETGGELHELWTGVRLRSMPAASADCEHMNFSSLTKLSSEAKAAGREFIASGYEMPQFITNIAVSEYVDRNTGVCSFTDPSFAELLMCVKDYTATNADIEENAVLNPVMLPALVIAEEKLVSGNDTYELVGIPGVPSGGNYYMCGAAGRGVAIPRASANKAGAWAYIKSELDVNAQLAQKYNISVINAAYEREAQAVLSPENVRKLSEALTNTTKALNYSDTILTDVVLSTVEAYINGDKTLSETVDIIQTRASIYVAEQYG